MTLQYIYSIYTFFSYIYTAIDMAQKATGLSTVDAAYSTSLGLLPLCLGYTIYGLLEDNAKENNSSDDDEITNNSSDMMLNSQVYWPGALAFATTATIVGKGSRLVIGLWSPLPTGVKLDARLLQTHPILRMSSNGIFSFVILAAGASSLLRSYQQYAATSRNIELNSGSRNETADVDGMVNDEDRGERKKETSPYTNTDNGEEKTANSLWHILTRQILTQFDNGNDNYVDQYAVAGGITGLGLYTLGPSALSLPVPLLVYLCNNKEDTNEQLSPHKAFHSLVASAIPYLMVNIVWFHKFGARPRLLLLLPFGLGVTCVYGLAESLVLPYTPDYVANAAFGMLALVGGGLKLVGSVRGLKKLL